MLVASIDTDRPPEGPPASTQACSRQRRATGSTTIHRQRNNTAAFLPVCGMTYRWGSSGQIQHNGRLQDPCVPSPGLVVHRTHRHPAHSTAFAHSIPSRRGSPLAQSTLRLLCRVVGAVPTVVRPMRLVATHPTMSFFFAEAPPCFGASPFQQIAAVWRSLRQHVVRSILRTGNLARSRRLDTVDTDESVGRNVGLAWRKASEVWFSFRRWCNFIGRGIFFRVICGRTNFGDRKKNFFRVIFGRT